MKLRKCFSNYWGDKIRSVQLVVLLKLHDLYDTDFIANIFSLIDSQGIDGEGSVISVGSSEDLHGAYGYQSGSG
ncbi:MAG: hypothetical protein J1E62_06220 [Lachnospiraceae bacterium]|nr:hypothetical protein [Lachnospiraceae bacterium]